MKARVAVAISGSGRTLANFIEKQDDYSYEIAAVIASSEDCAGLRYASENKIPLLIVKYDDRTNTEDRTTLIADWLNKHKIDWVALAGFLKPWPIINGYADRTVNIHPALLPKFGGKGFYGNRVHQSVIDQNEKESGASVHFVTEKYDEGRVIAQSKVKLTANDTATSLALRVFESECRLYPHVLSELATGELPLAAGKIWLLE